LTFTDRRAARCFRVVVIVGGGIAVIARIVVEIVIMMGARCDAIRARGRRDRTGAIDGAIDGLDSRDRYVPSILIDIDRY
jgi:hypothetical protein